MIPNEIKPGAEPIESGAKPIESEQDVEEDPDDARSKWSSTLPARREFAPSSDLSGLKLLLSTCYGRLRRWFAHMGGKADGGARHAELRAQLDALFEESRPDDVRPDSAARQHALLANVLKVQSLTAEDIMVRRASIKALPCTGTLEHVLRRFEQSTHSRMPIYGKTLDEILGFVHIKDLPSWLPRAEEFSLKKVLRDPLFIAPSIRVLDLMMKMQLERCHLALVVDEYGGVDGLVTIEDTIETIVGDIHDEHDPQTDRLWLVKEAEGVYLVESSCRIEALIELAPLGLSQSLAEDAGEVDTIGGLVMNLARRVPVPGELIQHASGLLFEVLEADPRTLRRLRIRMPNSAAKAGFPPPLEPSPAHAVRFSDAADAADIADATDRSARASIQDDGASEPKPIDSTKQGHGVGPLSVGMEEVPIRSTQIDAEGGS